MVEKESKTSFEAQKKVIIDFIREEVTSQSENLLNMVKMSQKITNSTLESLTSAMTLMEKQFNMKIGGLKGNQIKKQKEDDILATFESPEDLLEWLDKKKNVAKIDKESTNVDTSPSDYLNSLQQVSN